MSSLPEPPGELGYRHRVQRSQWLSDLASALDRADQLTGSLEADPGASDEVAALRTRIGLVRTTLALVRAGRTQEIDPNWLKTARQLAPLCGDEQKLPDSAQTPSGKSPPPPKSSR